MEKLRESISSTHDHDYERNNNSHAQQLADHEAEGPLSYAHHRRSTTKRNLSIRFKAPKPPSSLAVTSVAATDKGKEPMMMVEKSGLSSSDDDNDEFNQYYDSAPTSSSAPAMPSICAMTAITTKKAEHDDEMMIDRCYTMKKKKGGDEEYDDVECGLCKKRFESVKQIYFHLKEHSDNDWKTFFSRAPAAAYSCIKDDEHDYAKEKKVVVDDMTKYLSGNIWGAVKKRKRSAATCPLRSSITNAADDHEEVRNAAMNLMRLKANSNNNDDEGEGKRRKVIVFAPGDVEKAAEGLLLLCHQSSSSSLSGLEFDSVMLKSLYDGLKVVPHAFDLNYPPPEEQDHPN